MLFAETNARIHSKQVKSLCWQYTTVDHEMKDIDDTLNKDSMVQEMKTV